MLFDLRTRYAEAAGGFLDDRRLVNVNSPQDVGSDGVAGYFPGHGSSPA